MTLLEDNSGITLIEIILSIAILALVIVPTLSVFAASIANNRASQLSIKAKYTAERYMEIVKATPPDQLDSLLTGTYGFTHNGSVYENGEGVQIKLTETGYTAGHNEDYDFAGNLDFTDALFSGDIVIRATGGVNFNISRSDGTVLTPALSYTITEDANFELFFDSDVERISIINETGRKLSFYCVNKDDSTAIPEFEILEGQVAFFDLTVPPAGDRHSAESDMLFTNDGTLVLAHNVTVTVTNANGAYALEGLKAIR